MDNLNFGRILFKFATTYFKECVESMRKKIPYMEWRDQIRSVVPQEDRIGNSLLFVENKRGWDPGHEPFIPDVATALIVLEGETELLINMKRFLVTAPSVIVLLPDVIVQQVRHSDGIVSFAIVMSPDFLAPMIGDVGMRTSLHSVFFKNPVHKISDISVFESYRDLLRSLLRSPTCEYRLEAARHLTLTLMYGYMLTRQKENIPSLNTRNERIVKNFLDLVRDEYMRHRDVTYYADQMCISPKYLSMAVKEASGKTPLDWIDDYTISASKAMLSSSSDTIDSISLKLNFASQSLFGKFFKRVTGMSPRDYRKSLR